MTDIVSLIDRAVGCQMCERDLGGSVSDDFCSEDCQTLWHSRRVGADPSPLCGLLFAVQAGIEARALNRRIQADWEALAESLRADMAVLGEALVPFAEAMGQALSAASEFAVKQFAAFERAALVQPSLPVEPMARALVLRQRRNTGPAYQQRPPRAINPRRVR